MTQYDQKLNLQNTAESFCPLRPSENGHQNPEPKVMTHIQELTTILVQKKSQLKNLKMETQFFKGKFEQQDRRINEAEVKL